MTTITTLSDVRAAMVARGYPAEEVDAMLDLAGRMILEGSLASKDDLNGLREEFTQLRIDVIERLAAQRVEYLQQIGDLRSEMNGKFAEMRSDMNVRSAEMRSEMDRKFGEMRSEMNAGFAEINTRFAGIDTRFAGIDTRFAEQRTEMQAMFAAQTAASDERERRIIKWVAGTVIAGIAVNAAVLGIMIGVVALLIR